MALPPARHVDKPVVPHEYNPDEGRKHDTGKLRWDLLPIDIIEQVVDILTYGAAKYDPNNWQKVDTKRHYAALMRHLSAWRQGEEFDKESDRTHLAHALCDLIFIAWQEKHKTRESLPMKKTNICHRGPI